MLDAALHAWVGDVGAVPRIHGKSFARGGGVGARNPSVGDGRAKKARLRLGVPKTEGKVSICRER
jgi:hypothetical protein